jgi:hypothetical protein
VGCLLSLAPGCVPQGSDHDELVEPARAGLTLRRVGESYEIEVQAASGLPPRSASYVLRIGDSEFASYRFAPTVGRGALVFVLSAAEFSALADGSPVTIRYGRQVATTTAIGTLDKSAVRE